jgi:hypothetical protein
VRTPVVKASTEEWVPLFNGKDLSGWKVAAGLLSDWEIKDGILSCRKQNARLFSQRGDYRNFHFRIEAKVSHQGIAGQGFRARYGGPQQTLRYYTQTHSTHPVATHRTGTLFIIRDDAAGGELLVNVPEQLTQPNQWFTQEIIAVDNHIRVLVN